MYLYEFSLAVVPSDAPPCARCAAPLTPERGAVRARVLMDLSLDPDAREEPPPSFLWLHARCSLDVNLDETQRLLSSRRANSIDLEDKPALRALAKARVAAIRELGAARRNAQIHGTAVVAPTIEPARDPSGRPRVTVAFIGSLANAGSVGYGNTLNALTLSNAFTSPRHEYVLETYTGADPLTIAENPAVPLVASVFGALADVRLVKAQRDKLAVLRAIGAPTPLLWIVGVRPNDRATLDKKVLELRKALDDAGFAGDSALVLSSERLDQASLSALGVALDESLATVARPSLTDATHIERALSSLEAALNEGEIDQLAPALKVILEPTRTIAPSLRARLAAAAVRCLAHEPAWPGALMAIAHEEVTVDPEVVLAFVRARLESKGRTYGDELQTAVGILVTRFKRDAEVYSLLVDHFVRADLPARRRQLLVWRLALCAEPQCAERVRAFGEGLEVGSLARGQCDLVASRIDARVKAVAKESRPAGG